MRVAVGITVALITASCTSDPKERTSQGAVGSACVWIGGTWQWNGCGEVKCVMYQDNCDVHMECTNSTGDSNTGGGTLTDNIYSFNTYCTATIVGRSLSGSCTVGCTTFTATHP